ncbi:MAG TPA: glycosyltransferase family 2 protein [Paludibaculum sp.]|jgi:hypothetical protein
MASGKLIELPPEEAGLSASSDNFRHSGSYAERPNEENAARRDSRSTHRRVLSRHIPPLALWGALCCLAGLAVYALAIFLSIINILSWRHFALASWIVNVLWVSGFPTTVGIFLIGLDLALFLPEKRRTRRQPEPSRIGDARLTVALTAYNDEESIAAAVKDFRSHPLVARVLVVSNNSTDLTAQRAAEAGAIVFNETSQGYGACVYRCFAESLKYSADSTAIVLCEGDRTFRADDLEKLLAYQAHADVVNGTRIVEQLRAYHTQLSTFMYYGNFFAGKLLELKHLGKGTVTDVGTTYKIMTPDVLSRLLPFLNPGINMEFNAHLMDTALRENFTLVECPVTFHSRVGVSKGGNVDNWRATRVGLRMITGFLFGWRPVK